MNKKGQALVEFVILLPILIMLLLVMLDFGIIMYNKIKLENKLNDVVIMINDNNEDKINNFLLSDDKNIKYNIEKKDDYKIVTLSKSLDIMTPGLNIVLDNPYNVSVKRTIYNE